MGPIQRLRKDLFANPLDGLVSVLLLSGLAIAGYRLLHWALTQARWAVIQANSTLLAVGRYPIEQQWRLWLLVALVAAASGLSWGVLRGLPVRDRPKTTLWPSNDRLAAILLVFLALWLCYQQIRLFLKLLFAMEGCSTPLQSLLFSHSLF